LNEQKYLFKQVYERPYYNISGATKIQLDSIGMVTSHMFFLRRSDANLRNEWSNYTNWPYRGKPDNPGPAPNGLPQGAQVYGGLVVGPGENPDTTFTGIFTTGDFNQDNQKEILQTFGILLDGEYRENTFQSGIYNYIEKYTRTPGNAPEGLYCYEFGLNSSIFENQPSGAMNLTRFRNIELEFTTFAPAFDLSGIYVNVICDTQGNIVGISNTPSWRLYQYNYNLTLFEERYNVLSFVSGNCGLLYAK
jgi:hypothetical protein